MKKLLPLIALLAAIMLSCGSDADHAAHGTNSDSSSSMEQGGSIPGEPAEASEAAREVEVVASDELRFDPSSITVSAGEVVTFVIRNKGNIDHEFVLGDADYQEAHEKDMADGGHHMSGMDNAISVGPGETAELTWRFEEAGEVLYGCHEPGHYDGGMVGTVEVG